MPTPIKTRSQGPADPIDLDHPEAKATGSRSLNIEDELAFYGSYHSAVGNRIIHFICIPLIMWSTLVLVSHYYIPGSKLHVWPIGLAFQPSIASLIAIGYQLYYIRLEPIGGITFIPWSILIYGTAAYTYHFPPAWAPYSSALHPTATPLAWMVFAFSWIAQFIGHGVFEKRAPALKDNLVQALVTAPFFVHLEILFDGFNYRPELQKRIKNKVGIRIRDFRRASKKAE